MRSLITAGLLTALLGTSLRAQDSTRLKRFEYVIGSSLAFSLCDYIAFNWLKKANGGGQYQAPVLYRIIQGTTQAAITYFLYKECGLTSAISFNLIWWTWNDDFAYYGWGYMLGLFPWESSHESGLRFHEYNSAGWTPIGLLRPQGSWIAKDALMAQAVVGLSVSIAILW